MAYRKIKARFSAPDDYIMNIGKWPMMARRGDAYNSSLYVGIMRDVYPRNFLSEPYLSAPVGFTGLSLIEWIEANPTERGELKPFTETLTEWAPPVENIPKIREALFRAGRLFYWRFFLPTRRRNGEPAILQDGANNPNCTEPEPFYRPNIHKPWEWTGTVPEIYRAEYYNDKDPGLIY